MSSKQITFDGFLGMNNRADETSLPEKQLRRLVNMDVGTNGNLSQRSGYELVNAGQAHSLWSDGMGKAYFVRGGTLYAMGLDYAPAAVDSGFSDAPVSYCEVNGEVYLSDGNHTARIDAFGNLASWGIETPAGPPALTAQTAGGLDAGSYQIALTYLSASGEESGASETEVVDVVQGGGIYLGEISQPTNPNVQRVRVYMSQANGDALYWNHDLAVGQTASFAKAGAGGKMLETQYAEPMPAGQIVRYFNGRLLVASANTLWYSNAYNYGLMQRATNFYQFPSNITLLEPVGTSGVYLSTTDRMMFLRGQEATQFVQVMANPLPAVSGSGLTENGSNLGIPNANGPVVVWMTTAGWMLGAQDGMVTPLSADKLALPQYDSGATIFKESDGVRQLVSFMKGGDSTRAAVSDSITGEIIRNGVLVE